MQDQMEQARNIALSHSSMATIDTESFFHGKEAYLSFIGKDQEGQELAVLVAEADDQVYAYPLKEGINQKKAKAIVKEKSKDAIDRVTFGRFKGKPIWEVKSGRSYYVVDFKTGKVTSVFYDLRRKYEIIKSCIGNGRKRDFGCKCSCQSFGS